MDDLKEREYDYTYQEGENIYPGNFDSGINFRNGFIISDEKSILDFLFPKETKIAEVILPDMETAVILIDGKYKVNRIILKEIRDLWTINTFQWLKECGVNIHMKKDVCLCVAAENGYLDVVKFLVEDGGDIHTDRDYPLIAACGEGHYEIVKYLLGQGADKHACNDMAIQIAKEHENVEIEKLLLM